MVADDIELSRRHRDDAGMMRSDVARNRGRADAPRRAHRARLAGDVPGRVNQSAGIACAAIFRLARTRDDVLNPLTVSTMPTDASQANSGMIARNAHTET